MKYICQLIAAKPLECGRLGLQILVPLADNDSCVKTFCNTSSSISSIMVAMKNGHEAVAVGQLLNYFKLLKLL